MLRSWLEAGQVPSEQPSKSTPATTSSMGCSLSPHPSHPGPGARHLEKPLHPEPWNDPKQPALNLLTLPRLFLLMETTVKALTHVPPSLCLLTDPGASPRGPPMVWDPPLGICEWQTTFSMAVVYWSVALTSPQIFYLIHYTFNTVEGRFPPGQWARKQRVR